MSGTVIPPKSEINDTAPNQLGEIVQETLALTRRLFIQLQRRPSTLLAGIIQPVMWLILFGALFQNAPKGIFGNTTNYAQFFSAGIIVFTAFVGALNAGLPVMSDRKFGFLNRLLVAPLASRFSIVFASAIFIISQSLLQSAIYCCRSSIFRGRFTRCSWLGCDRTYCLPTIIRRYCHQFRFSICSAGGQLDRD